MRTNLTFIIHQLKKEVNGVTGKHYRDEVNTSATDEEHFVDDVMDLFANHQAGRLYGGFESDAMLYPFPALLTQYLKDGNLVAFSKKAADLLAKKMNDIPAATGGFFFVVRFSEGNDDILLLCMLNQKQSQAVDPITLTLTKSISLQMDQLDLTAQINITDWHNQKSEPVSLIRGRKKLSHYFRDFIGLHEPRSNTEATRTFRDLADTWMDEQGYEDARREKVRQDIIEYHKRRGDEPLELDTLAKIVDPNEHDAFFERANGHGLSAEFHLHLGSLRKWERVNYVEKDGGIRLNFPKRLWNTRVTYNETRKTVTIKGVELKPEDKH